MNLPRTMKVISNMFDFSVWELAVVGGVALVVLGPERLPIVARCVGRYVRATRAFTAQLNHWIDEQQKQEQLEKNQQKADAVEILKQSRGSFASPLVGEHESEARCFFASPLVGEARGVRSTTRVRGIPECPRSGHSLSFKQDDLNKL